MMPILPAVAPKASVTRLVFTANSPGASRLTTMAAVIKARKALTRKAIIIPSTTAIPIARISNGPIPTGAWLAKTHKDDSPHKIRSSLDALASLNHLGGCPRAERRKQPA